MTENYSKISVNQLRIGMMVHIPLPWEEHPFLRNPFKIKNEKQIVAIGQLNLEEIEYSPSKSDVLPHPKIVVSAPTTSRQSDNLWEEKQRRIEKLTAMRKRASRCESSQHKATIEIKNIFKNLRSNPKESLQQADSLVSKIETEIFSSENTILQTVTPSGGLLSSYDHVLDVIVLAVITAKRFKVKPTDIHDVAIAALFHDIGETELPYNWRLKQNELKPYELEMYQSHPLLAAGLPTVQDLSPTVVTMIQQHHELIDGSGYPMKLFGMKVHPLSQVLGISEAYSEIHLKTKINLSPHEAVSLLYRNYKDKFLDELMSTFVTSVGVYPPGTVVMLSDGNYAMVKSVPTEKRLSPEVMIYDREVPQKRALLLDIADEDLEITKPLSRDSIPQEVLEYFNLEERCSFYCA